MTERTYDTATAMGNWPERNRGLRHIRLLSWEAIVAGVLIALSVQIVLGLFGTAAGLASVNITNPDSAPSAQTVGIGAAMWSAVSILIALFYGGFIAARLSATPCRHEGILRGLVVWGVSTITIVWLLSSSIGGVLTGAAHVMGGAGSALSSGMQSAAKNMTPVSDHDADTAKREADSLLRGNGAPPATMTPDQVKADMTVQFAAVAAGGDNAAAAHQRLVGDLESQGVAPADAEARVADWQAKSEAAKQKAKVAADETAHAAAKGALGAGVMLVLSALTAAFGGALGAAHVHDRHKHHQQAKETEL